MGEYNIGQFIYRSRKAVGLTQEELCHNEFGEKCFSVETLSRIECGKQRPYTTLFRSQLSDNARNYAAARKRELLLYTVFKDCGLSDIRDEARIKKGDYIK